MDEKKSAMNINVISMDWWKKFHCIGAKCSMTCCDTRWHISLTDQEIENYRELKHSYQPTIWNAVDSEKKRMVGDENHKCLLLTPEGWCSMVQKCGEDSIPFTCKVFPREIHGYGDVLERTISIACPVAAGYLFEALPDFDLIQTETEEPVGEIDYELYDTLAWMRDFLSDFIVCHAGNHTIAKLFVMLQIVQQTRQTWQENGKLTREMAEQICESYGALPEALLNQIDESVLDTISKARTIQHFLRESLPEVGEMLLGGFGVDNDKIQEYLVLWMSDMEVLQKDIRAFSEYSRQQSRPFFDSFFMYALFQSFIVMEPEGFGKDLMIRGTELLLIQLLAMALFKRNGKLVQEEYEKIIAGMERKLMHTSKKISLYRLMEEKCLNQIEELMLCLVV